MKIIIVDDEKRVRSSLRNVINIHYPDASVIGEAGDLDSAIEAIKMNNPDVVLLDIKMPGGTGFDLLKRLVPFSFKIIFITAYDEYAVQAFKFSALDYLLKPVMPQDLVSALQKAEQQLTNENFHAKFNVFLNNMGDLSRETKKIVLNSHAKMQVIAVNEIVRCEADKNYTKFILIDHKTILVSGQLKEYEEKLGQYGFFRSHHSHLVNLYFIDRLEKRDGGLLIMKDGSTALVSARKHCELVSALNQI